ncbi:hypothetical protein ACFYMX_30255 [Streptomyces griseofuscus]|uniref:Uncharacterized protein n=2 Tax=Actinomycetes TaxID=1760 RepID=A0ABP8SBP7_9ACTN|nr:MULTISPECIES: hypothetical protein [Streptomyces]MBJ7004640.1 hypothetical protein [Streptomyces sp. CRPSP2-6A1]MCE3035080.1 hypothetical protein [Streptomyces sp. CMSTAAHL-2]MYQ95014.1 hypothetical protein [Streptomyces sp. SID4946]TGZ13990.1 hypothetical protein DV517_54730 [Streptomyces sp. S816]WDO04952.1 hypothetical protein ME763_04450 [Streptomyces murinus]
MPWWALIPVVSMVTGPLALYVMTRRKRAEDRADERYEELSRKYTALLEETTSGELPHGRDRRLD